RGPSGPMGEAHLAGLPPRAEIGQPLLGQCLDGLDRFPLNLEEATCFLFAEAPQHGRVRQLRSANATEAAIAARSSRARLTRLQKPHREVMVPLQMQRSRQPCVASADDDDITGSIFFQGWAGKRRNAGAFLPPAVKGDARIQEG